jgi:hypothetical protein
MMTLPPRRPRPKAPWKLSARRHKKKVRTAPVTMPAPASPEPSWTALESDRRRELEEKTARLRSARLQRGG